VSTVDDTVDTVDHTAAQAGVHTHLSQTTSGLTSGLKKTAGDAVLGN
jgi:hypothetical protein